MFHYVGLSVLSFAGGWFVERDVGMQRLHPHPNLPPSKGEGTLIPHLWTLWIFTYPCQPIKREGTYVRLGRLVAVYCGEDGFLRVHAVFRLIEYDGIAVVYHAIGQFLSSVRGHVVHKQEVGLCGFH